MAVPPYCDASETPPSDDDAPPEIPVASKWLPAMHSTGNVQVLENTGERVNQRLVLVRLSSGPVA